MKQKLFITVLMGIFFILASNLCAYEQASSGLAFLKVNPDPRLSAMGGSGIALSGDNRSPASLLFNPALNNAIGGTTAELGHAFWYANSGIEFLGFAFPTADWNLGVLITSANISGFEYRENRASDEPIDTFGAHYLASGINAARALSQKLTVGIQVNYLYEKIYYQSATGFGISAGLHYRWTDRLNLGAALDHLGFMRKLRDRSTPLPTALRFGAAYTTPLAGDNFGVQATADAGYYLNDYGYAAAGLELRYQHALFFRGGFQYTADQMQPALGFGIHWERFVLNYSVLFPDNTMDVPQQLGLSIRL